MEDRSSPTFDLGLEAINPTFDLVIFEGIQSAYDIGQDIFLIYQLGQNFHPQSHDWVGLYRSGWRSADDYISYEWAPMHARDSRFPQTRSVLFKADGMQVSNQEGTFQFLYISRGNHVVGVSPAFLFMEPLNDISNLFFDPSLDDFASVNFTDRREDTDSFEHVAELPILTLPTCSSESIDDLPSQTQKTVMDGWLVMDADQGLHKVSEKSRRIENSSNENHVDNREMSLVPYDISKKAVIEYRPEKHAVVPYNPPAWLVQQKTAPSAHQVTDTFFQDKSSEMKSRYVLKFMRKLLHESSLALGRQLHFTCDCTCLSCLLHNARLQTVMKQLADEKKKLRILTKQLLSAENSVIIKEVLMEQLSDHMKNLVEENCKLMAANERLVCTRRGKHMMSLKRENKRLREKVADYTFRVTDLASDNKSLALRKGHLEKKLKRADNKFQLMRNKFESVQNKLETVQTHHVTLENHLDDIMYTLAIHGFTHMVDIEGRMLCLETKKGKIFRLDGWHMAQNKRSAHQMSLIASKESLVKQLQEDLTSATKSLTDHQHKIKLLLQELKDEKKYTGELCAQLDTAKNEKTVLQSELTSLQDKLTALKNQRDTLLSHLCSEQKQNAELQRNNLQQEEELMQRIRSLQDSIEAANIVAKRNTKQNQTTPVKMNGQGTQVKQKTHNTASLTDPMTNSGQWSALLPRECSSDSASASDSQTSPISVLKVNSSKTLNNLAKSESYTNTPQVTDDVHPKMLSTNKASTFLQNKISDHVTYIRKAWEKVSPMAATVVSTMCPEFSGRDDESTEIDFDPGLAMCSPASLSGGISVEDSPVNRQPYLPDERVDAASTRIPTKEAHHATFTLVNETEKPIAAKRPFQKGSVSVDQDQDLRRSKRQRADECMDPSSAVAAYNSTISQGAVTKSQAKSSASKNGQFQKRPRKFLCSVPGKPYSNPSEHYQRGKHHSHHHKSTYSTKNHYVTHPESDKDKEN